MALCVCVFVLVGAKTYVSVCAVVWWCCVLLVRGCSVVRCCCISVMYIRCMCLSTRA